MSDPAVSSVTGRRIWNTLIAPVLTGLNSLDQTTIDKTLTELAGQTPGIPLPEVRIFWW